MSHQKEATEEHNHEFKWGTKRGIGGPDGDVQFYESFTYNGVEYSLYDCVYMCRENEPGPGPDIGKLVKIWETSNHARTVKVVWFFRPSEIYNWLGDVAPLHNEIFLASGEGKGLSNLNPLEAISGKCNVVCTSKDKRNPQESEVKVRVADYVFSRTFDVRSCKLSDIFPDKIAGTVVQYFFNRRGQKVNSNSRCNANVKENIGKCNMPPKLNNGMENGIPGCKLLQGSKKHLGNSDGVCCSDDNTVLKAKTFTEEGSGRISCGRIVDELKFKVKYPPNPLPVTAHGWALKKIELVEPKAKHSLQSSPNASSDAGDVHYTQNLQAPRLPDSKSKCLEVKDFVGQARGLSVEEKVNKDGVKFKVRYPSNPIPITALDDRPLKKRKLIESMANRSLETVPNASLELDNIHNTQTMQALSLPDSKSQSLKMKASAGQARGLSVEKNINERDSEISNGVVAPPVLYEFIRNGIQVIEVMGRPESDEKKWFKPLPWGERMLNAHSEGTLVLLENLDPSYSSSEIEGIVLSAFEEKVDALVIERTAFSSPHNGQAFVIFKSKKSADLAISALNRKCLMLTDGRLVTGRRRLPRDPTKEAAFFGHLDLVIYNKAKFLKHQKQHEEMKKAVSTSHCSQRNTIEYRMALQWLILQQKSDFSWKAMHEQHAKEMEDLRSHLREIH